MKQISSLMQAAKWRLLTTPLLRRLHAARPATPVATQRDLVFVTPPRKARGWILEAICREIGSRLVGAKTEQVHFEEPLPPAQRYFHSHYMYFVGCLTLGNGAPQGKHYVFATHLEPDKHRIDDKVLARLLDRSDGVICMNTALRDTLLSLGVSASKLSVVVGAADKTVYTPHARSADGKVGFCSAFYARKSPELVFDIVRAMPRRSFMLIGHGWHQWSRFSELLALPNFEYVEADYRDYPALYRQMSVFVSVSQIEGGPIPLLESMMCNVVPVVSRTGFAPDVIRHGENGFIFDTSAPLEHICSLIDEAYGLQADVSATVQHCDWLPYSHAMANVMAIPSAGPDRVAMPANN